MSLQSLLFSSQPTDFIMFDTECTGLSPQSDRIVELGMLRVTLDIPNKSVVIVDKWHSYFDPKRLVDPIAVHVHGLTNDFLAGQPSFQSKIDEILAFCKDAPLVAHNALYDEAMMNAELKRGRRSPLDQHVSAIIDTLPLAREVFPGKKVRLDDLCDFYEVDKSKRVLHGALIDCELLAEVCTRLFQDYRAIIEPRVAFLGFDPYTLNLHAEPAILLDQYAKLHRVQKWLAKFADPLEEAIKMQARELHGIPLDASEVLESFALPLEQGFELKVSRRTITDYDGLLQEVAPDMTPEQKIPFQRASLALSLTLAKPKKYEPPVIPEAPDNTAD